MNSTSSDLDLSQGEISYSLLKAGSHTLQEECSSYVAEYGGVPKGGIAVTGPGKLSCKRVIHTVGVPYEDRNSEEVCISITVCVMFLNVWI